MKVLSSQNMGEITPKNEGTMGSRGKHSEPTKIQIQWDSQGGRSTIFSPKY